MLVMLDQGFRRSFGILHLKKIIKNLTKNIEINWFKCLLNPFFWAFRVNNSSLFLGRGPFFLVSHKKNLKMVSRQCIGWCHLLINFTTSQKLSIVIKTQAKRKKKMVLLASWIFIFAIWAKNPFWIIFSSSFWLPLHKFF